VIIRGGGEVCPWSGFLRTRYLTLPTNLHAPRMRVRFTILRVCLGADHRPSWWAGVTEPAIFYIFFFFFLVSFFFFISFFPIYFIFLISLFSFLFLGLLFFLLFFFGYFFLFSGVRFRGLNSGLSASAPNHPCPSAAGLNLTKSSEIRPPLCACPFFASAFFPPSCARA